MKLSFTKQSKHAIQKYTIDEGSWFNEEWTNQNKEKNNFKGLRT